MFRRVFFAVLILFGASLTQAPAAFAQNVLTLDRILPQIRRVYPGNMSDAQGPITTPDGQVRYRIKWVTPDGQVIWIEADARTGRILSQSGGGESPPAPQRNGRNNFRNDESANPYGPGAAVLGGGAVQFRGN